MDSREKAESIAKTIVDEKLAACANIIDGVSSYYWWQGKTEWAKELLLVIKTNASKVDRLIDRIKAIHPYSVPEIIALPIVKGNKPYLDWIDESLK